MMVRAITTTVSAKYEPPAFYCAGSAFGECFTIECILAFIFMGRALFAIAYHFHVNYISPCYADCYHNTYSA